MLLVHTVGVACLLLVGGAQGGSLGSQVGTGVPGGGLGSCWAHAGWLQKAPLLLGEGASLLPLVLVLAGACSATLAGWWALAGVLLVLPPHSGTLGHHCAWKGLGLP